MTNYPNLKNEPELLKIKTRDDEIKNIKFQTEKYDHENILKSLKIDNEYYKKKYKSLDKKKVLLIITKILIGSASTISSSTMGLINPGAGIIVSSSTALLTSIAILITNEYISNLKIRYENAKCTHGYRSAMSNSAWCDLNKNCNVLKLRDVCHNPKCNCQKITFTPKQF